MCIRDREQDILYAVLAQRSLWTEATHDGGEAAAAVSIQAWLGTEWIIGDAYQLRR